MGREEYLAAVQDDPWSFPAAGGCPDPPAEWIAAAWDMPSVHDAIAGEMAREVSKNGELGCPPEYLGRLSAALRADQVVRLYRLIRDESPHREEEFRAGFEEGFARHAAALPPPLTRRQVIDALAEMGFDEATAGELMGE